MNNAIATLITILLGFFVFVLLIPQGGRDFLKESARAAFQSFKFINAQLGGYVHDTAMSQFIPPTAMHCVTGTWTDAAGAVSGTIARHKAASAETATVHVPLTIPSNSVAGKGSLLKDVELDYELLLAGATSVTLSISKVVRGADTAVAVVSAPAGTQLLTAATSAATQDQHRDKFTLTTPVWIDDEDEYFLKAVFVCGGTVTIDLLGAVAHFTARL